VFAIATRLIIHTTFEGAGHVASVALRPPFLDERLRLSTLQGRFESPRQRARTRCHQLFIVRTIGRARSATACRRPRDCVAGRRAGGDQLNNELASVRSTVASSDEAVVITVREPWRATATSW